MQEAEFSTTSTTLASSADVNNNLAETNVIVGELSDEALLKMEVIQSLLENSDRTTYTQRLQQAAEKLGKSVRTVRRLVDRWEQEGLAGLAQNQRADKGKHRVDENWQEFVLKTYKEGNKGSKRMTRQQVFIRVKARADELGIKPRAIARWEKFRFNPSPSRQQLEALATVVGVDADRLEQMLTPVGVGMNLEPIRLCGACYVQSPCHRIEWQFKVTRGCRRHQLGLLSECPNCGARFKVPALWVDGWCQRCFMGFGEMARYQKLLFISVL